MASFFVATIVVATATPAGADHPVLVPPPHSPGLVPPPHSPGAPANGALVKGNWNFIKSFLNVGTDEEFFTRDGKTYGAFGTFLQAAPFPPNLNVGVRILQLADNGVVNGETVKWISDHYSAHCAPPATSSQTGIQHDVQVTPFSDKQAAALNSVVGQLVIDSNDAPGRCHDVLAPNPAKGGIEIVDISNVAAPDEIHLVRLFGEAHNSTVDTDRPWIVYVSNADPPGSAATPTTAPQNHIDIVNIKSCFGPPKDLRTACRPVVHRFQFEDEWTIGTGGPTSPPSSLHNLPYACHDITYSKNKLYCAAINTTLILDVSDAFNVDGSVKGLPLQCDLLLPGNPTAHPAGGTNPVHPGASTTGAGITDCAARNSKAQWMVLDPRPQATGVRLVGVAKHSGRDSSAGPANSEVLTDISISHESDATPDGKSLLITDERGGGLLIPAASCSPGVSLSSSNGGLHFYDISDPATPKPRKLLDGRRAVYIAPPLIPAPTFCNIHVIEQVPDENRLFIAWYSQGTRVLDFYLDEQGRVAFEEVGHWLPPGADQWVSKPFVIKDNEDGTRTYYLAVNNITRGIDVVSYTAKPNRIASVLPSHLRPLAATGGSPLPSTVGMLLLAAALLLIRLLRRRQTTI